MKMDDSSLFAPWTGINDSHELETVLTQEVSTLRTIHRQNLDQFEAKKRSVLESFADLEKKTPIKRQHCLKLKERYFQQKKILEETVIECQSKYNKLLDEESRVLHSVGELDKISQKLTEEEKSLQERLNFLKRQYKKEKCVLDEANKLFCRTFGMKVAIDGDNENGNIIKATVTIEPTDVEINFLIDKASNTILDFDAGSAIPNNVVEELKAKHLKSQENCAVVLVGALRNQVLKK